MKMAQSYCLLPEELEYPKLSSMFLKEFRKEYFLFILDSWLFVTKLKWLSEDAPSRSVYNKAINH